jgi:hypothetical protein
MPDDSSTNEVILTEKAADTDPPLDPLASLKSRSQPSEKTYCLGSKYWRYNEKVDEWVEIPRPILELVLKDDDKFCPYTGEGKDVFLSPLEREIKRITMDNQIIYAGPLAGHSKGPKDFDGQRALVTADMDLLEPKKGEWPTLKKVFDGAFITKATDGLASIDQRDYLFGWWQHAAQCLYVGPHSGGLALFLCGERKSGKTLTAGLIRHTLGKVFARPYAFMTGQDNFNEELFEAVVQWIDDESSETKFGARLKFGANIKQMVAADGSRMRGMHKKARALRPLLRLIVNLNMEPDRLSVIPALENDVEDKMLILKTEKREMPMPARSPDERAAFWAQLTSELPAFLWWLLNEFTLTEELKERFGVKHWCHPEIEQELRNVSPEQRLLELIERWFRMVKPLNVDEFNGSTTQLREALLNDAGLSHKEQDSVPDAAYMGKMLRKLEDHFPNKYSHKRTSRCTIYRIHSIGPIDTNPNEIES